MMRQGGGQFLIFTRKYSLENYRRKVRMLLHIFKNSAKLL
jgi:hypothetical protein